MKPEDLKNKNVLISPLNWGMGHVSRCIGLIDQLKKQGNSIVIACSLEQQEVFEEYFDDVRYINHREYPFKFGGKGRFALDLVRSGMRLNRRLKQELIETELVVKAFLIDVVISDHRYGFRSKFIPSIFVTHQVNLPVKRRERFVNRIHQRLMSNFDFWWVMDDADSSLAGDLSRTSDAKAHYIGWYSRFSLYDHSVSKEYDKVLIASGPNVYAQQLIDEVCGKESKDLMIVAPPDLVTPVGFLSISVNWRKKDEIILASKHVISRSGYSTLMDCIELGVDGTVIPTKGQAEQEYLSQLWLERKRSATSAQ